MATPQAPTPSAPSNGSGNTASAQPTKPTAGAPTPAPTPAQTQRMLKVKLDGKEIDVPESEVLAGYQQGKVANQRFQEAAALKKQADEILAFGKANPKEFLAKMGMNVRQWAEEYLIKELEVEAMSPEQKKARENEDELRKYKENEKKDAERKKQAEIDGLTNQKRQEFDVMFTQALTESGLPKTPFTVKRMAELQLINIKKKLELNAQQLAKLVKEDYAAEHKSLFGALDGDQLIEALGPELVKKLSKAQIAKLKSKGTQTINSGGGRPLKQAGDKNMTWREYQRRNRKI